MQRGTHDRVARQARSTRRDDSESQHARDNSGHDDNPPRARLREARNQTDHYSWGSERRSIDELCRPPGWNGICYLFGSVADALIRPPTVTEIRPWVAPMVRVGYAAKGLIYLLTGVLALRLAVGMGGRITDASGVLRTFVRQPFGWILLTVIAVGILAYAAWQVTEALMDAVHKGGGVRGWLDRSLTIIKAAIYGTIGVEAMQLVLARRATSQSADDYAREAMEVPFGSIFLVLVGIGIAWYGVSQIWMAWQSRFDDDIDQQRLRRDGLSWVLGVGRAGIGARGVTCRNGNRTPARRFQSESVEGERHGRIAVDAGVATIRHLAARNDRGGTRVLRTVSTPPREIRSVVTVGRGARKVRQGRLVRQVHWVRVLRAACWCQVRCCVPHAARSTPLSARCTARGTRHAAPRNWGRGTRNQAYDRRARCPLRAHTVPASRSKTIAAPVRPIACIPSWRPTPAGSRFAWSVASAAASTTIAAGRASMRPARHGNAICAAPARHRIGDQPLESGSRHPPAASRCRSSAIAKGSDLPWPSTARPIWSFSSAGSSAKRSA